jgi:tryptophan halogenase
MIHICTIGDGASGLMAANFFASRSYVSKVTHIGSSKIPSIGVGESTTLVFEDVHRMFDKDIQSFILQSHATVKTGVLYSNWGEQEYLNFFKPEGLFKKYKTDFIQYSNLLANKSKDVHIHDIFAKKLYRDAKQNKIPVINHKIHPLQQEIYYGWSWHFDAAKYIAYLKRLLKRNKDKVTIIDDVVVDCEFKDDGLIDFITLESGQKIKADYYVVSTGTSTKSAKIFNIEYQDLSDKLLTDKALFFPKPYQEKQKEMHPYTIAKTMKYGWRWITPTWSRIGTGYVFSSKYITVDEAIKEFQEDIGDDTIVPNVVDFHPKYNKKTFNKNYITLGMCNGFLEPLDAPGLSISCGLTLILNELFKEKEYITKIREGVYDDSDVIEQNKFVEELYNGWTAFILTQYKNSHRSDSQFWIDQKNVKFEYLDNLMLNLYNESITDINISKTQLLNRDIIAMIQNALASRNVQWKTNSNSTPFELDDSDYETIDHYDFLSNI